MGKGFPQPPDIILIDTLTIRAGELLFRVHKSHFQPTQFNPTDSGKGRFNPIKTVDDTIVPTLYAGGSKEVALMETVFRNVPYTARPHYFDTRIFENHYASVIVSSRPLTLARLHEPHLRKLGISESALTKSTASRYGHTQKWAEAIHRQMPELDGLAWYSRHQSSDFAFVLFGDRVKQSDLWSVGSSSDLLADSVYPTIELLANHMGITLI